MLPRPAFLPLRSIALAAAITLPLVAWLVVERQTAKAGTRCDQRDVPCNYLPRQAPTSRLRVEIERSRQRHWAIACASGCEDRGPVSHRRTVRPPMDR
jgi:hypothetical protein